MWMSSKPKPASKSAVYLSSAKSSCCVRITNVNGQNVLLYLYYKCKWPERLVVFVLQM